MSGMTLFHIQLDDGFGVSLLLTLGTHFKTHVPYYRTSDVGTDLLTFST